MSCGALNKDKMKKVLLWLSETIQNDPTKKRTDALREAQIRFDLSPKECQFLENNFNDPKENSYS